MRLVAFLGVAALTAVALLGTSCSSDDDDGNGTATGGAANVGGQTGATGGASSTATTKTTGGATSTATTKATGGATGVGGVTSTATTSTQAAGGSTAAVGGSTSMGGTTATGGGSSVPLTGGIELSGEDGNYLEMGDFKGVVWITDDSKGENATRTDITYSNIEIATGEMCVTGTARKVPLKENPASTSDYDYAGVWGAEFGWNLNQVNDADGGTSDPMPADVSNIESVTVNFEGVTDPAVPLRVQVLVPGTDGAADQTFCTTVKVAELPQTIPLTSLVVECWAGGKKAPAFDPATMQPSNLQIQVYTDTKADHPFNFCMTELTFNSAADAG